MPTALFTETLQAEVAALQTEHPLLKGALDRAYTLLIDGNVFPLDDGRSAHVRSQRDPAMSYLVNGSCDCASAQYRTEPCAHRFALRLYQRVSAQLAAEEERWNLTPVGTPIDPALPEAPAPPRERAGMRLEAQVVIEGRQVKVALWGPDDAEVLARLASLLQQYPVPTPASQAPTQPQGPDAPPQCPQHGAKKKSTKGKGWYCPRKLEDGSWCNGKAVRP